MAGYPLSIEPLQMEFERTFTGAKDVRAPTAQHSTNEAAAVAGAPHDLLDRASALGKAKNGSIHLFPAQITLVLDSLGGGEEAGIDRRGAGRAADLPHGFLHSLEEGTTGVLHEMPTVRHLSGVRQRPGSGQRIAAAPVARHNRDLGLVGEPSLCRRRLAVRQQRDRLASFKITDDRAVALVSLPGPVINPHHGWSPLGGATAPSDETEKAVVTHGDHQSPGKTRRRAPAESQAEVMDHVVKSSGSPGPRRQSAAFKP